MQKSESKKVIERKKTPMQIILDENGKVKAKKIQRDHSQSNISIGSKKRQKSKQSNKPQSNGKPAKEL